MYRYHPGYNVNLYDAFYRRCAVRNNINNGQVPIRKLYVAPITIDNYHKIQEYFERFGEVESVQFHVTRDASFYYAFVQFKWVGCAEAALDQGWHQIGFHSFKVKPAFLHHQPRQPLNPLLIAPNQGSALHILIALNDDCLRKVFGYLDLRDLSHAANACVRFNQLARAIFTEKYKDLGHYQSDLRREPPNPLLIAPEQDSPLHILIALNDDCLREVFGYLDPFGLSNATKVCVRFNQQAEETFADKYKDLDLTLPNPAMRPFLKHQIENLCKTFGSQIRTLKVDALNLARNVPFLYIASQYCTELKELQLSNFNFKEEMKNIRPLFTKLEQLEFKYCEFGKKAKDLHSICPQLRTLILYSCDMYLAKSIRKQFAKLECTSFTKCTNLDQGAIETFVLMNPSLTKLSIVRNDEWDSDNTIRLISDSLNMLVELEIDQEISYPHDENIESLGQLRDLKVLKLNLNGVNVTPLLNELVENKTAVEDLKLHNGKVDKKYINYLAQMKQLKRLELNDIMGAPNNEQLIRLAKELPNLSVLHLKKPSKEITIIGVTKMLAHAHKLSLLYLESVYSVSIKVDDYKAMLKTIEGRPEKVKLEIKIKSNGDKVQVDECMLAGNRDIFYIDEQIEDEDSSDYDDDDSDDDDDDPTFHDPDTTSNLVDFSDDDSSDDSDTDYYESDVDSENGYVYVGFMDGKMFYFD